MSKEYSGRDVVYSVSGKSKKFDGKIYQIVSIMTTKAKAENRAKALRSQGLSVRISESSDGYRVYVRNK